MYKQAIAGVAPPSVEERTVMTVWPSIAAYPPGRWLGGLYANSTGFYFLTFGNLVALLSIPHALALYAYRLLPSFFGSPFFGSRYVLTNRRIVELRNEFSFRDRFPFVKFHYGVEVKAVDLDRFDTVEVAVRRGQEWFKAGDLIFTLDGVETFRLAGVSRPQTFRHTCLKSRDSYVGVKQALEVASA